jgi:2-oxoisovalerate dehydrogenase E1 component alpha subunit
MSWIDPAAQAPIETFRLMDHNSVIEDESRISPEVTPEVVLGWYKNMLTGEISSVQSAFSVRTGSSFKQQ